MMLLKVPLNLKLVRQFGFLNELKRLLFAGCCQRNLTDRTSPHNFGNGQQKSVQIL